MTFCAILNIIISTLIICFLLVAFIHWACYICGMRPNSAIELNMPDAIYAFQQGKIKRHSLFWDFYTTRTIERYDVKVGFFTFVILNILYWINKRKIQKKMNKEATDEFLRTLYEEK